MISASRAGFTLLELVVVLVILSAVVALVVPRLPSMREAGLRTSARQTAALLRYLDERAVATKQLYRLRINLDEQRIDVVVRSATGDDLPADDPYLQRNPLASGTLISDLTTERLGRVTSGQVLVSYGPGGLTEPLLLHFALPGGASYTVQALPVSSMVRVFDGYREDLH
jgi:general secretion pathway protein H